MIPEPYELALLALAAARLWKLIGDDRILDRPREWVLERTDDRRDGTYWGDFLVCPWCAGAWCSVLVYAGWIVVGPGDWQTSEWYMGLVTIAAISALVGLFGMVVERLG